MDKLSDAGWKGCRLIRWPQGIYVPDIPGKTDKKNLREVEVERPY
jgi:hypothetical protein